MSVNDDLLTDLARRWLATKWRTATWCKCSEWIPDEELTEHAATCKQLRDYVAPQPPTGATREP